MTTPDAKSQILDQAGQQKGQEILTRMAASEERGKKIEEEVVKLSGAFEDFKTRYMNAANAGRPLTPNPHESPDEFISRAANETAEENVVRGIRMGRTDMVRRGLAGVFNFSGLGAMRTLRCLAVSWLRTGRSDFDVAAKFAQDELLDKRAAGHIEEARDLVKDAEGSDVQKRERARRALGTAIVGAGAGFLKPEQYAAFMDYLHPMSVIRALGASSLPMPNGMLKVPYLDTAATAAYRGVHGAATTSDPGEKILTLTEKMLAGQIVMANELLKSASFAVEVFMRAHLARVMATTFDLKAIRGLGVSDELRGLDWWLDSSKNSQVSSSHKAARTLSGGVATARTIRADLLSCQEIVEEENIGAQPSDFGYAMCVREKYGLMRVRDTQDRFEFADEMKGGTLLGAKFAATTQIPKTAAGDGAGSGTNNKSSVYGVNFASVVVAEVESPQVEFQSGAAYKDASGTVQSGFSQNESALAIFERHDFGLLLRGKEGKLLTSVDWGVAF